MELIFIFLKYKIYSIDSKYSIVSSKISVTCLLKLTLEYNSVMYFQVILNTFNNSFVFVKLLDHMFCKLSVEKYFARD